MRLRALLPLSIVVLLLAGCSSPAANDTPAPAAPPTPTTPPAPSYTLAVRVSEETPSGPGLAGAIVQAGELGPDGKLLGTAQQRVADNEGWARFSWPQPAKVAVQAVAQAKDDWTVEGAVLDVGHHVAADRADLVVSERDLFLPLYRPALEFTGDATWETTLAEPNEDGSFDPRHIGVDLAFPAGLQAEYLARLLDARVVVSWEETATMHGDIAAGLAWGDALWVAGESSGQGIVPGVRAAVFDAVLPTEGRPADPEAATLRAAAATPTAVVGDLLLSFNVTLGFGDLRPAQLPDPRCTHATTSVCVPLPF